MNYAEIKTCDIANGPGVRVSLFVSGCNHRCKNCFNEVAWDFGYGKEFTRETMDYLIGELSPYYIRGLTLLGGEPMEYQNQVGLLPFLRRVKKELPDKDIWCFTGYLFDREIVEEMCPKWEMTRELLSYIDVMVDGRYVEELHDITLLFRGSSNQRLIDVPKSLAAGSVVLWGGSRDEEIEKDNEKKNGG
ncbi:MAG: anaerobic ribonucleoside-triphosphate reductase activating protein [Lachnospiraceae bacterium]|nr:anaerobic ribonucleoside-triphosphate reductase activating protein [Lachnospiraceae bacterium]MBD5482152.1 anaerobic ribonucleoside-triphosphate reductase activating protein [Lachnospiraceae bacterium]